MTSTAPSPLKLGASFASLWLATPAHGPFAGAARNHHGNSNNNRRRGPPPHHPAAIAAAAASNNERRGSSPNFDMYGDSQEESFYERNGLKPPPLVSRASRPRRAQTIDVSAALFAAESGEVIDNKPAPAGVEEGGISGNIAVHKLVASELFNNASSDVSVGSEEEMAADDIELGLMVEEAKSGNDPATRIRADLIRTGSYDKNSYPWEYAWHGQEEGSRTGVPVEFSINFHRVFSVDIINPGLDIIAWVRIEWVDPRLTWKPEEYGNLTKTWFWIGEGGAGGETSEIWTPDIELWNLEDGLRDSFDDAYAIVSHDGSVYWSRPGHLRPACKFVGLDTFPFDRLTCTMEFGSWTLSGKYMRLVKGVGGGFSMGGSETSGESFNEFSFAEEDPVQCILHVYPPYPSSPEEDWPALMYNVTLERSWQPYARGFLLTQVLLNIIGFSAFWLPPSCGERMGLSITAMLAAVTAEVVVAENLPAAAEYTWFQKFNLLSMSFACIALLESVVVLYFYYKRSENLIPGWFTEFRKWHIFKPARKHVRATLKRTSSTAADVSLRLQKGVSGLKASITKNANDEVEDSFFENDPGGLFPPDGDEEEKKDKILASNQMSYGNTPKECLREFALIHEGAAKRVDGDSDDNSMLSELSDRAYGMISTSSLHQDSLMSNLSFDGIGSKEFGNDLKPSRKEKGGKRVSFSEEEKPRKTSPEPEEQDLPSPPRPGLPSAKLPSRRSLMQQFQQNVAGQSVMSYVIPMDADDFHNEEEILHNRHWKHTAARIDDVARFWIPLAFFIAISIVLSEIG